MQRNQTLVQAPQGKWLTQMRLGYSEGREDGPELLTYVQGVLNDGSTLPSLGSIGDCSTFAEVQPSAGSAAGECFQVVTWTTVAGR